MAKGDRVRDRGVEFEVVWDGTHGCFSLSSEKLGDSSLGPVGRDADRAMGLGRHETTLAKARAEFDSLWAEDEGGEDE